MSEQLSGFQRFLLVKQWRKYHMEEYPDKEDFIRKICQQKGLSYTPPIEVTRGISRDASMFPVKEK